MRETRLAMEGLRALGKNRVRTLFMMAGTLLGIASLTVVMALNEGAREEVEQHLSMFGADAIRVRAGGARMHDRGGIATTLKIEDARALAQQVPDLASVRPSLRIMEANLRNRDVVGTAMVFGLTEDFQDAAMNEIIYGRPFDRVDVDNLARVCVIGQTVQEELFGDLDPLGKRLMVNRVNFTVVGVLSRQGAMPNGMDADDRVLIPLTTAMKRVFKVDYITGIEINSADKEAMDEQAGKIEEVLRRRHHIGPGEEDDFMVMTASGMAGFHLQMVNDVSLLFGALALLCLIVGGVVLMNIMLISVAERVREIGLRRALGASRRDVFVQFVIESVMVNIMGMLAGTFIGTVVFLILNRVVEFIPAVFSVNGLLLSISFSALVGLGFGILPARRAAGLSPVEALR